MIFLSKNTCLGDSFMRWKYILQQLPSHPLEDRANKILDQLGIQTPVDLNLRKIAKHFRIPVIFRPENSSAQRFGDKYLIIVDKRLSLEKRREQLAEEICHCLLPMGNQLLQKEWETNKQENLAKRMAAYLLIPRRFISQLNISEDDVETVEQFSNIFTVTPYMVRYRFELDLQQWLAYGKKEFSPRQDHAFKVAEQKSKYKFINRD